MSDNPGETPFEEPANLKFLRRLVTTLTATMIIGLVVLIGTIVIRLQAPSAQLLLPDSIALPDGQKATAFTRGSDWYAVVTTDDQILIFDTQTSALRQTIDLK